MTTPNASRDRTFLIAKNDAIALAGAPALDFDFLVQQLQADPNVTVQSVRTPQRLEVAAAGPSIARTVVVATMPDEIVAELEKHPQVVVEEDLPVYPLPVPPPIAGDLLANSDPAFVSPFGTATTWQIEVVSSSGAPVRDATVYLYGRGIPTQGRTDASGMVTLSLLNETDSTLMAVYVDPQRDHWSLWVNRPALTSGTISTLTLTPLGDTFAGFPDTQLVGWGQQAMRLDQVPAAMDGRGVRVAVVDSGAAALTHPDLTAVTAGTDLTTAPANPVHWRDDVVAHGSHCTGIIAGADNGRGVRGFAPGAEVHEARIFPGGTLSQLMAALDYCVDAGVDVVNMSLGTGGNSSVFLAHLAQAKQQGVAVIVAAGNSSGPVQFPGISPDVLTVAAIGRDGTFPDSSYHAQQRWTGGTSTAGGYFAAQFSCHGDEVDVCGPGVAVVSSVPSDGFASWDGTSMATPHVTGLAVLVLAHHPDFTAPALQLRTAARVDRLFEILRASATPLDVGDATRTGAGLPDAVRALGLGVPGAAANGVASQQEAIRAALGQLRIELGLAGLVAVEPAAAAPAGVAAPADIRRALLSVQAQLASAGLPVPAAA
jgi:subtilisin